jgi:undecaprenyl-diphosphatase
LVRKGGRRGVLLACAVTCLSMFIWLAIETSGGTVDRLDEAVRLGIHRYASTDLTLLVRGVTLLGSPAVIASFSIVAVVALCVAGRRRAAIALAAVMAGSVVLENGLKYALHRARPEPYFGTSPETFSFPSGHALFSACFYVALAWIFVTRIRNRWRCVAIWMASLVLIAAIGLSRIYLGVHYPSDVIAGYLVAGFWITGLLASRSRNDAGMWGPHDS